MTAVSDHRVSPIPAAGAGALDHTLADDSASTERHYACLAVITHLRPGDGPVLRRVGGVTGVVDTDTTADAHLLICARSLRAARRQVVALIADAVPHAVVTVPDVVDYDAALLDYLDRHGHRCGQEPDVVEAFFDDGAAVHHTLDRLA